MRNVQHANQILRSNRFKLLIRLMEIVGGQSCPSTRTRREKYESFSGCAFCVLGDLLRGHVERTKLVRDCQHP